MNPIQAVAKAAQLAGSKAELARLVGVKPPTVHQWLNNERPVPPARALQMEEITKGQVSRRDLCPSFPWEDTAA